MWLASEMAAFAQVSELKSFTAAARALGVPKVAISRAIASLEKRLETRLLIRTTRRVSLTPAGQLLQPHCRRLLAEVEAVRAQYRPALASERSLRLLVDSGYGRLLVTPLVPRFLEHYAQFELSVGVTETLPREPGDWQLLVCNGSPSHDALRELPLGEPPLILCATPAYLTRHGRPRQPTDLDQHTLLRVGPMGGEGSAPLQLARAHERLEVRLRPTLAVSDPTLVHSSTAAGLGIGVLPEFLVRQGLAMGKLERLLPEWTLAASLRLRAVYRVEDEGRPALRQFVEFLLAHMAPVLAAAG